MNSTQAQQDPIKNVTMTIIFDGAALNRDEKIGGSILSIKKMKVNGEVRSFISKAAIRHHLFETLVKGNYDGLGWAPAPVKPGGEGDKKVIQFDITRADILTHAELDVFGYMYTIEGERSLTRKAPIGITKALSLMPYEADISFYGNHDLASRARSQGITVQKDGRPAFLDPNPYTKEENYSVYKVTFTVDAAMLGRDVWMLNNAPENSDGSLTIGVGNDSKAIPCRRVGEQEGLYEALKDEQPIGTIRVEEVQRNAYRLTFQAGGSTRRIRLGCVLNAIKNGLYAQSSGEANTIVPLFMIAGAVTVPSPVFHSFIDVRVEDGKLNVIGIKDGVNNGWVDGKVFIQQSERLCGRIDPTISERTTDDWDSFLRHVGVLDQQ